MVALKLEGAIVVEGPVESAGERDYRSRQREHLMDPRSQGLRDKCGFRVRGRDDDRDESEWT